MLGHPNHPSHANLAYFHSAYPVLFPFLGGVLLLGTITALLFPHSPGLPTCRAEQLDLEIGLFTTAQLSSARFPNGRMGDHPGAESGRMGKEQTNVKL